MAEQVEILQKLKEKKISDESELFNALKAFYDNNESEREHSIYRYQNKCHRQYSRVGRNCFLASLLQRFRQDG